MSRLITGQRDSSDIDPALATAVRPIADFLNDPRTIEIMLNDDGKLWVERFEEGMFLTDVRIKPRTANMMLKHIAECSEQLLSRDVPSMAGSIPHWRARVQAWIPPITSAPAFTIRMPARRVFSLEEYRDSNVITGTQYDTLVESVLAEKNILVGGGAGSGKTTLTNALLRVVSEKTTDRSYIVEDTPELQFMSQNKLTVRTKEGVYDTRRAVRDALRARPDRLIVGELRDGTALDMIMAWHSGHPGVASLHASSAVAILERICELIELVAVKAPRHRVADVVDVCVHMKRDRSSSAGRRISGIVAVEGYDSASGKWLTKTLH